MPVTTWVVSEVEDCADVYAEGREDMEVECPEESCEADEEEDAEWEGERRGERGERHVAVRVGDRVRGGRVDVHWWAGGEKKCGWGKKSGSES